MNDLRRKNVYWRIDPIPGTDSVSTGNATLAVLMDIRDELQTLNRLLGCANFIQVPDILRMIRWNTEPKPKPKPRKKATKKGGSR